MKPIEEFSPKPLIVSVGKSTQTVVPTAITYDEATVTYDSSSHFYDQDAFPQGDKPTVYIDSHILFIDTESV